MSSVNNLPLTTEQEDLLRELEEEFKDRYTENDENFMAVFKEKSPEPPVVENWFDHRFRNRGGRADNDRRHGYTYEGDRHYDYNDRHHRYHSYEDYNDRRQNYDHHYRRYRYHNQKPY